MEFDKKQAPATTHDIIGSLAELPTLQSAYVVESSDRDREAPPIEIPGEAPVFQHALGVSLRTIDGVKEEHRGKLPSGPILIDTGIDPFANCASDGIFAKLRHFIGL